MPSPPPAPRLLALLALAALALALLAGNAFTSPPSPVPASAPADAFSSARALAHIRAIAVAPHPVGSPEHARVRAYLVEQLRALGLDPQVHDAVTSQRRFRGVIFGQVHNVVARLPGTGAGKALLLMAHYDSRAMTPGASDDGYGTATLLETTRALLAAGPRTSPVIVLLTDGEEEGLLGAHAFVKGDPWARDVEMVLNFDARGNAGPVLMYQTGEGNGAVVREMARSAPHIVANSLSQAIYKRMPNDSDLSEWLPATPSLNFANIGGFERYHAPTDTADNADEGTLQHDGSYALSLARAFAAHDLPLPREPDATYFNLGPFFVHYPGAWDLPLALVAAALAILFVALGHRRGTLRAHVAALGVAGVLVIGVAAVVLGQILWALVLWRHPSYRAILNAARPAVKDLYLAAFLALSAALPIAVQAALRRWLRAAEIFAGGALLFAVPAVLAAVFLPGAAYVFTWPLLVALPAALLLPGAFDRDTAAGAAGAALMAAPALFMLAPLLPMLVSAFGPGAAPIVGVFVVPLAAIAAPALRLVLAPSPRRVPLVAPALALVLYVGANLSDPFGPGYPRPDTLVFAIDAGGQRAWWVSPDRTPDAWTRGALEGSARVRDLALPYRIDEELSTASVPPVREPAPAIVWSPRAGSARPVRVVPPPGADLVVVRIEGATSAEVMGAQVARTGDAVVFRFFAPPAEGIAMTLALDGEAPVTVHAVSRRPGFPQGAERAPGPRPPGLMPKPGMMPPWDPLLESDNTIVAAMSRGE